MMSVSVLLVLVVLIYFHVSYSFRPTSHRLTQLARSTKLHVSFLDHATSQFIAAGGADYASEIENAVGEEIYGPIFKAGLFLFGSGIVAAFGVAFIVSKSDTWNELESEFDDGKKKQLIVSDAEASVATRGAKTGPAMVETAVNEEAPAEQGDQDIDDLDI